MGREQKTAIVTGASQGIGAGVVQAFLARGYNVVGTSREATKSKQLAASAHLVVVDGDIGEFETARHLADAALKNFGSIRSSGTWRLRTTCFQPILPIEPSSDRNG